MRHIAIIEPGGDVVIRHRPSATSSKRPGIVCTWPLAVIGPISTDQVVHPDAQAFGTETRAFCTMIRFAEHGGLSLRVP